MKLPQLPAAVKTYALRVALWLAIAAAGALAYRFGFIPTPPPLPPFPVPEPIDVEPEEAQFYCGRVETLVDFLNAAPWPVKRITWTIDPSGYRGPLEVDEIRLAFDVAWKAWAQALDFEPA